MPVYRTWRTKSGITPGEIADAIVVFTHAMAGTPPRSITVHPRDRQRTEAALRDLTVNLIVLDQVGGVCAGELWLSAGPHPEANHA